LSKSIDIVYSKKIIDEFLDDEGASTCAFIFVRDEQFGRNRAKNHRIRPVLMKNRAELKKITYRFPTYPRNCEGMT